MRLYHRTTREAADAILTSGFIDGRGTYLTDQKHVGVWLSDRPLDINDTDRPGRVLLAVDVPTGVVAPYEWVQEGQNYHEFLVPASILNAVARVRQIEEEEHLMNCERCGHRGIESPVHVVLTISDIVDELPDGDLQTSNENAFTVGLCLSCGSDANRMMQEWARGNRGPDPES